MDLRIYNIFPRSVDPRLVVGTGDVTPTLANKIFVFRIKHFSHRAALVFCLEHGAFMMVYIYY